MIKVTLILAATIALVSTIVGTARAQYYDSYLDISPKSTGAPPLYSEYPGVAGGGSLGYNDNLRKDAW